MKKQSCTSEHSPVDNSVAHTPGPWVSSGCMDMYGAYTVFHKPFGLGDIAECYGENAEANANLIAAAPDLLAALDALLLHAEIYLNFGMVGGKEKALQLSAHAAIAKARGEK